MKPKILLIEDDIGTRFGFARYFSHEGYQIVEADTLEKAEAAIAAEPFDAILLDITLPDGNGLDMVVKVRSTDTCIPVIVITGSGDIPLAVEAMRRGADNFLVKPVDNAALSLFLRKSLEVGKLKRQQAARLRLQRKDDIFFGEGQAVQQIIDHAQIAATNDGQLLITGETGTGKGMLAKWIHRNSNRAGFEFVEINCSGLRGELLAREIFGNVRGAYTSADQDRKGLLDVADRGTLFLDEIGEMGLDIQAQFLKVLEEKSYRRLGDVKLLRSDFRLICATNRDVENLAHQRLFRQDLLYRINLMVIDLPPLRERIEDLPALVKFLLHAAGHADTVITAEVMRLLKSYSWPGNIRELKNVLERALLLARGGELEPAHFSGLRERQRHQGLHSRTGPTVQQVEEAHIAVVLKQTGGNVDQAAQRLGISRATLYRKLKKIEL
ncbi:MAG: hypothetical protein A2075_04445 [Geobacteraceae bacterium GWC2_58_44]|nr:MAG: hypothetical protein A2075_04445 [Geobacteraceae bacterium GWC2_58_44]HBG04358.1 sigma-54-dependent Fis family transcriptional regulator [Geobacter sp.]